MLQGDLATQVRDFVHQTCKRFQIQILRGVASKDDVYILILALPNMSPSGIIRRVKGQTSCKIFDESVTTGKTGGLKL